jgi:hypothetical protein
MTITREKENIMHADVLIDQDVAQLDAALTPPVVAGVPQAQGDLIVIPWGADIAPERRALAVAAAKPIPEPGIAVVRGQGGNTHLLVDPDRAGVGWAAEPGDGQTLGTLVVPPGAVAFLDHPEHGRNATGPGVYVIRRQREMADEIRLVQD